MSNPELQSLISEEMIELDRNFDSKMDAIKGLLDLIDENGKVEDREQVLEDLKKREEEATTGVGKGVGIPHAKTEGVEEPVVGFIRAEEGVDFEAPDEKPARLLFMLLFPEDAEEDYLDLLSDISRSLIHDDVREELLQAGEPGEVMDVMSEVSS